jgi:hypothetical protein
LTPRKRTLVAALVLLVLTIAWEAYTLASGGHAWTFSRFVWELSGSPLFNLAVGVFIGHFFFQKEECLHCGFRPYRRDRLSEAAFDLALLRVYSGIKSGATFGISKRAAGLPDFEVNA